VPLLAPAGTVAVIWVAELTVKLALVPLNATAVAPFKLLPVIVTDAPTEPLVGLKPLIDGVCRARAGVADNPSSVSDVDRSAISHDARRWPRVESRTDRETRIEALLPAGSCFAAVCFAAEHQ